METLLEIIDRCNFNWSLWGFSHLGQARCFLIAIKFKAMSPVRIGDDFPLVANHEKTSFLDIINECIN